MAANTGRGTQKRARRRRSAGLGAVITVLLIAVIAVVGAIIFFRVTDISVEGTEKYTAEQVTEASGIRTGSSMLLLRKEPAAAAIKSEMPYIGSVSIEKQYPGKVVISVDERQAVACMRVGSETWLFDSGMRALEVTDGLAVKKYAFIKGFSTAKAEAGNKLRTDVTEETKLKYASEVLSGLEELDMIDEVTFIDMSNIGGITIRYQDRFTVKLGTGENVDHKLARLNGIVPYLDTGDKGTIDVSGDAESYFIPD